MKKKTAKAVALAGVIVILFFIVGFLRGENFLTKGKDGSDEKLLPVVSEENTILSVKEKKQTEGAEEKENYQSEISDKNDDISPLPEKIILSVPFTSQAPFAIWDQRHEEACEEACLVMARYFLIGKNLDANIAEKEINSLIDFQIEKYGDYKDSDTEKIVRLGKDFYEMKNMKVVYEVTAEKIKQELARGNLVIVPAAGQLLNNPYFTPPGPLYHNLILRGYDEEKKEFITNDPGTKWGENYRYPVKILLAAIHDFPGTKEKIMEGKKAMVVIFSENGLEKENKVK